jgi:hypothetical protein
MKLDVTFSSAEEILLTDIADTGGEFPANFGELNIVKEYVGGDPYDGDYEVTPKVDAQTMPTKGMVMEEDVTIKSIPFFDVSNMSGGTTVYIAKEI